MTEKEIIVFSTKACPYCVMVKKYLEQKGVTFTEKDVGHDQEAAKYMIDTTNERGVPQLKIGDDWIIGFNKKRIDELLKL